MSFTFESFVRAVRRAAGESDANAAVRMVLEQCVADPDPIVNATPLDGDDEVMLFEDQTLSIWRCCFQPHILMPPHEHKLDVHIAAYSGGEKNILFQCCEGELRHERTQVVRSGEVLFLDDQCIHAVTSDGDDPSLALHVYMGPLMQLKRALFDWETGDRVDFTMENFDNMKRPASALCAY
jgi:predicted metal-dependent enzyme (double-stranded beta helix superfamily)